MSSELELQRKSLPHEPGIYIFKNKKDKVIYIGKAIDLKKRVSSYFLKSSYTDPYYEDKINELVKRITSIDFITTETEKEALILENVLIKKHHPRFNVIMRDSKSYPWIAITYSEDFPRIRLIRNPDKYSKNFMFLGPYTDKQEIFRILRDLRKIFPFCSCKRKVKKRDRACLYHQLKLCPGPCIGAIEKKEYLENIKQIELFLKGETEELKNQIQERMEEAAEKQNYEAAAFWRDKLNAIDHSTEDQNVLLNDEIDKDIVGFYYENDYAALIIVHIREGRMTKKSPFTLNLKDKVIHKGELLSSILESYYQNKNLDLPEIIIVPEKYVGIELLEEILGEEKEEIHLRTPLESQEKGLLRIAHKNAKVMVKQEIQMKEIKKKEEEQREKILKKAQKILDLPSIPRIIEGFDISNIGGKDATGSMVYFYEGEPSHKNYRHYNIRGKSTPDDVGMMKEVIYRRYSNFIKRDSKLPDLILVDGGRGQLNGALEVLEELGLEIPTIGLAKRFEEIYVPELKDPIKLPDDSSTLHLFQQIRDEAHRFAVRLHKKQRKKRIKSELDSIKGVGPVTRKKLLSHFGSVKNIKKASLEDLEEVVNQKLAQTIMESLRDN